MAGSNCVPEMTTCPECVRHVRHCEGAESVECPFCEVSFSPKDVVGGVSASAVPRGVKKGMMAASFVGMTVAGSFGCVAQPEYGAPAPENSYSQAEDAGGTDADAGSDAGEDEESDDGDDGD